jgi:hypothetical protein
VGSVGWLRPFSGVCCFGVFVSRSERGVGVGVGWFVLGVLGQVRGGWGFGWGGRGGECVVVRLVGEWEKDGGCLTVSPSPQRHTHTE